MDINNPTYEEIVALIAANLPDNKTNLIRPALHRQVETALLNYAKKCCGLKWFSVLVTESELNNLQTTPVVIIPFSEADKVIVPIEVYTKRSADAAGGSLFTRLAYIGTPDEISAIGIYGPNQINRCRIIEPFAPDGAFPMYPSTGIEINSDGGLVSQTGSMTVFGYYRIIDL